MGDRIYDVRRNDGQTEHWEEITGALINSVGALTLHRDNVPIVIYRPDWWLQVTLVVPQPEVPEEPPAEGGE